MNNQNLINQKLLLLKRSQNFRFVPELLSSNSDFRVIGENFVPNQTLDFYVGNNLQHTIKSKQ